MNIFIAQLDYSMEEQDVQRLFENYGNVDSVKVIMDRETGRSKGFGFVEMSDDEQAKSAIEDLNGLEVKGRAIVVKEAEPRHNARGGFNRGGGRGGFNRGGNDRGGFRGRGNDRGGDRSRGYEGRGSRDDRWS